jgi:hypothetical protein
MRKINKMEMGKGGCRIKTIECNSKSVDVVGNIGSA